MLELHEGLRSRLIASLTEGLKLVEARHGKFLSTEAVWLSCRVTKLCRRMDLFVTN